jgi:hypothetical protein
MTAARGRRRAIAVPVLDAEGLRDGFVRALARGREGYDIAELERELIAGRAQLWRGERAAMATRLAETDDGRTAHVWLGFGDLAELLRMAPGAEAWARAHGCRFVTISGRAGWIRVLKACGYQRRGEQLRKRL